MRFIRKLHAFCATTLHAFAQNPKHLIKYVVLVACSIVVVFQLTECFAKLFNPPIATHSFFLRNETISYPALTFCRNPAYNQQQLRYYNLSLHPKITNYWRRFDFDHWNLTAVFENMTYSAKESLIYPSLDGQLQNLAIKSQLTFNYGLCHTVLPLVTTRGTWREHGYSINLRHDSVADVYDGTPAGWYMFVHEPSEKFTECGMETSGRSEKLFIRVNEEIEIKLQAQHFNALPQKGRPCRLRDDVDDDVAYNFNACMERCQWNRIVKHANCTGPWMTGMQEPFCRSSEEMRWLIVNYMNTSDFNLSICDCPERCESLIYTANVMSRHTVEYSKPSSQLYLYYASKMLTVYQEQPGYDLNQFVSDIGGSLGFLLGLSVLGLIVLLEMMTVWLLARCSAKKTDEGPELKASDERTKEATTTTIRREVGADVELGVNTDSRKRAIV